MFSYISLPFHQSNRFCCCCGACSMSSWAVRRDQKIWKLVSHELVLICLMKISRTRSVMKIFRTSLMKIFGCPSCTIRWNWQMSECLVLLVLSFNGVWWLPWRSESSLRKGARKTKHVTIFESFWLCLICSKKYKGRIH